MSIDGVAYMRDKLAVKIWGVESHAFQSLKPMGGNLNPLPNFSVECVTFVKDCSNNRYDYANTIQSTLRSIIKSTRHSIPYQLTIHLSIEWEWTD